MLSLQAERVMKTHPVTLPEMAIVAMTRGMAGAGVGLLVAERVPTRVRRAVGWTLFAVGAATTVPIVLSFLGKRDVNA
jgi:hypothetical protein